MSSRTLRAVQGVEDVRRRHLGGRRHLAQLRARVLQLLDRRRLERGPTVAQAGEDGLDLLIGAREDQRQRGQTHPRADRLREERLEMLRRRLRRAPGRARLAPQLVDLAVHQAQRRLRVVEHFRRSSHPVTPH